MQPSNLDALGAAAARPVLAVRPEPGLARGVWEAPPWVFATALAAAAVAALVWLAWAARGLRGRKAAR